MAVIQRGIVIQLVNKQAHIVNYILQTNIDTSLSV